MRINYLFKILFALTIFSLIYILIKEDYFERIKVKYNIFLPYVPVIKNQAMINKIGIYNNLKEKKIPSIIFLGDSNIERFNWNEFFKETVFNRGISGSGSYYLLSVKDKLKLTSNTKIIISLGINDIYYGIEENRITNNIFDFVNSLSIDNQIIINSVLYVSDKRKEYEKINSMVENLNNLIKLEVSKYTNVSFLDINEKLSNLNSLDNQYTYDGVHLNALGYKIWLNELNK